MLRQQVQASTSVFIQLSLSQLAISRAIFKVDVYQLQSFPVSQVGSLPEL